VPVTRRPRSEFDVDGTGAVVHRAVVLADNPHGHRIDLAQRVTIGPDGTTTTGVPSCPLAGAPPAG
jgi:hypothetical protein